MRGGLWREEAGEDEDADGDADRAVGDVEGGPRVGEAHVQIEEQEIHDVSVEHAVGHVSKDAANEQANADFARAISSVVGNTVEYTVPTGQGSLFVRLEVTPN